ncbi:MAG: response regulator [Candidatus Omnitrophica bacterium]|nr:response regulator [Candidatus Omnitrophota bacterium]
MPQCEKLKLLLVEDEPDTCETFQSYFEKRGFVVLTTDSGREALCVIKSSKPDVVMLDITLRDENGVDVLKKLRGYDKDTKVIMVTGQQYSDEEIEKIKSMGLSGYYEKPVLLGDVAKRIFEVTGLEEPQPLLFEKKAKRRTYSFEDDCTHDLKNLVGIISQKCENFTLGIKDGIYKSPKERAQRFAVLMDDIQETVKRGKKFLKEI